MSTSRPLKHHETRPLVRGGQIVLRAGATSADTEVLGAFSEEHTAELANVSRHQLREWDRLGLLRPSYGADRSGLPYGRVYSFRDLVSARVLGQLRNQHRVPVPHLIEAFQRLSALTDAPWASTVLYVLGRRVIVVEPGTRRKLELVSGQRVLDIPLRLVITGIREAVGRLNRRGDDEIGRVIHGKFVAQNQPVLAGTRIPVEAIKSFAAAGYSVELIQKEYPGLTPADIRAAVEYQGDVHAA